MYKSQKRKLNHDMIEEHNKDMNKYNAFINMLHKQGAIFPNLSFQQGNDGLGVYADIDFNKDSYLFSIPVSLAITPEKVAESKLGEYIDEWKQQQDINIRNSITPRTIFYLFLIQQYNDPDSYWYSYVHTFPNKMDDPLHWSNEHLKLLERTNLHESVCIRRKQLKEQYDLCFPSLFQYNQQNNNQQNSFTFSKDIYTFNAFLYMHSAYTSRCFPLHVADPSVPISNITGLQQSEGCLLPLFDALNHALDQKVSWITSKENLISNQQEKEEEIKNNQQNDNTTSNNNMRIYFQCGYNIKMGTQIYNNYGAKSNEQLLMTYGFIIENNNYDTFAVLFRKNTQLSTQSKTLLLRSKALHEDNMQLCCNKIEKELLSLLRLYHCNQYELEQYNTIELDTILSIQTESQVLNCLIRLIETRMNTLGIQFEIKDTDFKEIYTYINNDSNNTGHPVIALNFKLGLAKILRNSYMLCNKLERNLLTKYYTSNNNQDNLDVYTTNMDDIITLDIMQNSESFCELMAYIQGLEEHFIMVIYILHELSKGKKSKYYNTLSTAMNTALEKKPLWTLSMNILSKYYFLPVVIDAIEFQFSANELYNQLFPVLYDVMDDNDNNYLFPKDIFTLNNFYAALIIIDTHLFTIFPEYSETKMDALIITPTWPKLSFLLTIHWKVKSNEIKAINMYDCKEITFYPDMCVDNHELLLKTGQKCHIGGEYHHSISLFKIKSILLKSKEQEEEQEEDPQEFVMSFSPIKQWLLHTYGLFEYNFKVLLNGPKISQRLLNALVIMIITEDDAKEIKNKITEELPCLLDILSGQSDYICNRINELLNNLIIELEENMKNVDNNMNNDLYELGNLRMEAIIETKKAFDDKVNSINSLI